MWKDIPGHEGRYQASDEGKVRSLIGKNPKVLSPCFLKGYEAVGIAHGGKSKLITVHRLVLMTFVGVCPEGKEARHIDGDNRNNRIENLEWATHLENMRDRYIHGTYFVGRVCSQETKSKIAATKIGKPRDEATREKLRIANTGKKASPETRRKVTEALLKRWAKYRAERSNDLSGA